MEKEVERHDDRRGVDEVGGSSDCESELTSDKDVKPTGSLSSGGNMTKANDIRGKKMTAVVSDEENRTPDIEILNCLSYDDCTSQGNCISDVSNERKTKTGSSDSVTDKKSLKIKSTLSSEESTAVVDMDIDSDLDSTEPRMKPLLKVLFRDEAVEKRFKSPFFKFISQKFEDCTILTSSENTLEIEVYDMDPRKLQENDLLDFNLDTTPGDSHLQVPNYGKTHDLVLSDKSLEKLNEGKVSSSNTSCFNCLGNHNLRDCPKAKDFREINKNRLKFQSQKEKVPKLSRYHLDEHQKFSHLLPGVISKKLRNALNLRRDQQPGFIYRMRLLGYPPAWLEEAKVSHSGVAMYDDTGIPVLEEEEEEGEILPEGAKDKFDINKIIEFPGFNVPLPNTFKDESKFYHCPALSEEQSKENLIKLLEPKTVQAYVKKSLSNQKCDEKSLTGQNEHKRAASPTIEEMEEKKRQLLMALNSEDSSSEAKAAAEATPKCETPTTTGTGESVESRKVGTVKNLEFGTPILKSVSPFSKLPAREQFSCNVSDVINFENLPNATGKYEAMKEVISKIRISLSKGQTE